MCPHVSASVEKNMDRWMKLPLYLQMAAPVFSWVLEKLRFYLTHNLLHSTFVASHPFFLKTTFHCCQKCLLFHTQREAHTTELYPLWKVE